MRFNIKVEMVSNKVVCGEKNYPDCDFWKGIGIIANEMATGSIVTISPVVETTE